MGSFEFQISIFRLLFIDTKAITLRSVLLDFSSCWLAITVTNSPKICKLPHTSRWPKSNGRTAILSRTATRCRSTSCGGLFECADRLAPIMDGRALSDTPTMPYRPNV